jgi:hypothetical protein
MHLTSAEPFACKTYAGGTTRTLTHFCLMCRRMHAPPRCAKLLPIAARRTTAAGNNNSIKDTSYGPAGERGGQSQEDWTYSRMSRDGGGPGAGADLAPLETIQTWWGSAR